MLVTLSFPFAFIMTTQDLLYSDSVKAESLQYSNRIFSLVDWKGREGLNPHRSTLSPQLHKTHSAYYNKWSSLLTRCSHEAQGPGAGSLPSPPRQQNVSGWHSHDTPCTWISAKQLSEAAALQNWPESTCAFAGAKMNVLHFLTGLLFKKPVLTSYHSTAKNMKFQR